LALAVKKLENHFPGIISIKFLLPEDKERNKDSNAALSFADSEMATKTLEKNQPTAIQGEINLDRHLAIARRIMHNNIAIGVVLAGVNYDFIDRILSATPLEKGYIELRQGKLVLATTGERNVQEEIDNTPIHVPNTDWELFYDNNSVTSLIEFSLLVGIVLIPALLVVLGFAIAYRKLSTQLYEDVAWVTKAFKDILTEKPLGEYPVQLTEIKHVISTLAQFKRVVNDKWFEI